MTDLMWANTKDSSISSLDSGSRLTSTAGSLTWSTFTTFSELTGYPDIEKNAYMLKGNANILIWKQEVDADAILEYTQLAVQLANLTVKNLAYLGLTPTKKKVLIGNKRGTL